jgi:hypothetical protein
MLRTNIFVTHETFRAVPKQSKTNFNFIIVIAQAAASSLQQDSTRLFQKLLRMFLNVFALRPTPNRLDVPYAKTSVGSLIF